MIMTVDECGGDYDDNDFGDSYGLIMQCRLSILFSTGKH